MFLFFFIGEEAKEWKSVFFIKFFRCFVVSICKKTTFSIFVLGHAQGTREKIIESREGEGAEKHAFYKKIFTPEYDSSSGGDTVLRKRGPTNTLQLRYSAM